MANFTSFLQFLLFLASASLLEAAPPRSWDHLYDDPMIMDAINKGQELANLMVHGHNLTDKELAEFLAPPGPRIDPPGTPYRPDYSPVVVPRIDPPETPYRSDYSPPYYPRGSERSEKPKNPGGYSPLSDSGTSEEPKAPEVSEKKKCTETSKLKSFCEDEHVCKKVVFNDDIPVFCPFKMLASSNNKQEEIIGLFCNKNTGEWNGVRKVDTIDIIVETESNVYCHFDDCDMEKLSPECGSYDYTGYKYSCPRDATLWTRSNHWGDWGKFTEADSFTCSKGKLHANSKPLPDGTQVRCSTHTTAKKASNRGNLFSSTGFYIAVGSISLIIVIAIILIIICVCHRNRKSKRLSNNRTTQRKSEFGETSQSPKNETASQTQEKTEETGEVSTKNSRSSSAKTTASTRNETISQKSMGQTSERGETNTKNSQSASAKTTSRERGSVEQVESQ